MERKNKFAIELIIKYPDTIEERLKKIFLFILSNFSNQNCTLFDLDATGHYGFPLSNEVELRKKLVITSDNIIKLLDEDGQIIEMDLLVKDENYIATILVVDGTDVNIISNFYSLLQNDIIGEFKYLDLDLFNEGINRDF